LKIKKIHSNAISLMPIASLIFFLARLVSVDQLENMWSIHNSCQWCQINFNVSYTELQGEINFVNSLTKWSNCSSFNFLLLRFLFAPLFCVFCSVLWMNAIWQCEFWKSMMIFKYVCAFGTDFYLFWLCFDMCHHSF